MSATGSALLILERVSVRKGKHLPLDGVSVEVEVGGHLAVLGASGAGKSTLLRAVAGLDTPSDGRVLLRGFPASEPGRVNVPPHRRGVAMVFQDLALWPSLSPFGNVVLGLAGTQLPRREAETRAREALAACGIGTLADRALFTLSGGERQRVALARALAVQPALLLLDEPFASLDVLTKDRLLEEVRALTLRFGITLVVVSHDRREVEALCGQCVVLQEGRVLEAGPVRALVREGRSDFTQAFFGASPPRREGVSLEST
jgi:ABC-type Fe3+/spermidine/putrescine transport system ATPase subunit